MSEGLQEVHIPPKGNYCLTGRGLVVLGTLPGLSPRDRELGRVDEMMLIVWSISAGHVSGVEVSGLIVILVGDRRTKPAHQLLLVDERADPEQLRWLVDAFQGRLGGPLTELAAPGADDLGFCQLPVDCRLEEDGQTIGAPPRLSVSLMAVPAEEEPGNGGPESVVSPLRVGGSCWTVDAVSWATEGSVSWPERDLEWGLEGCTGVFGRFRIET
jgi:uncharacterized protein DUF1326